MRIGSDPTSRELLDLIVERMRSLPVLLIVTFRPEFQPPWTGQPQVTMLVLNRLDRRDRAALVAQIAGKALPDEVADQIAERTDGVPPFVEELTRSVLESGLCARKQIAMCSTARCRHSRSRQPCTIRCWRGSTGWRRPLPPPQDRCRIRAQREHIKNTALTLL